MSIPLGHPQRTWSGRERCCPHGLHRLHAGGRSQAIGGGGGGRTAGEPRPRNASEGHGRHWLGVEMGGGVVGGGRRSGRCCSWLGFHPTNMKLQVFLVTAPGGSFRFRGATGVMSRVRYFVYLPLALKTSSLHASLEGQLRRVHVVGHLHVDDNKGSRGTILLLLLLLKVFDGAGDGCHLMLTDPSTRGINSARGAPDNSEEITRWATCRVPSQIPTHRYM